MSKTEPVAPNAAQFLIIGERTNITGSPKFAKALKAGDWNTCLAVARQQVESGANIIDVNVDEGMVDGEATMEKFLNLIAAAREAADAGHVHFQRGGQASRTQDRDSGDRREQGLGR